MKPSPCAGCLMRDGIILAQRMHISYLKDVIKHLRAIIARARETAAAYAGEADKVMSKNQPRAVWGYAKAMHRVAQHIYNLLG